MIEDSDSEKELPHSQPITELGVTSNNIASLYYDNRKLGCALFDRNSRKIGISEVHRQLDVSEAITSYVLRHEINVLLINERLRQEVEVEKLQVIVMSSKDYHPEGIESSLLLFESSRQYANKKDVLRAIIDLKDSEVEKAVGALTYHLLQAKLIDRTFRLQSIEWIAFGEVVLVSPATYDYLDLQRQQMHPCKGVQGRGKEGFTIFNLYLTFSLTDLGRRMLSDLFMNPTYNKEVLEQRYSTIEFMHRRLFQHEKILNKYLRKIQNVAALLKQFELIKSKPDDWRRLRNSLDNMILLQRVILAACHGTELPVSTPQLIINIQELDMGPIIGLLELLDRCLQFNPLRIKHGVDRQLDKLRNTYDQMQNLLTLYATEKAWLFDFSLQFQLQIGYVVVVPTSVNAPLLRSWQLQYRTESHNIYTNDFTRELDDRFGDICTEIIDIEDELIIDLESYVRNHSDQVRNVYRLLCGFDCWLAVAKVSKSLTRPKLSGNRLIVLNGWHMLLGEKSVNNHAFSVPFETEAELLIFNSQQNMVNSGYTNRCCVLSGPNGSGKTVYVKQISIIVFLAHIGSYVPAELACVPLVDQIVCSSSARSLYMDHYGLQQELFELGRYFTRLTNRSWVVLDEIGHSTSQANAETMLYSAVKFLTERQFPDNPDFSYEPLLRRENNLTVRTPLSFVVTHIYSLFNRDLLQQTYNLRFLNAMIYQEEDRQITYLYRIRPGRYNESAAIETCRKLQTTVKLVDFAEAYHRLIRMNYPLERVALLDRRCQAVLRALPRPVN